MLSSMLGKRFWVLLLLWTLRIECEARGSAGTEENLLRRRFQVFPHGFMVRLGGESGKCFVCSVLRLGGTWLFPLSSRKLVQICCSTPSISEWLYIRCNVGVKSELKWFHFLFEWSYIRCSVFVKPELKLCSISLNYLGTVVMHLFNLVWIQ